MTRGDGTEPIASVAGGRTVEREPTGGVCPECGAEELARYPVVTAGGWFVVVKCQQCLRSVERRTWSRLGHVDRGHADRSLDAIEGAHR